MLDISFAEFCVVILVAIIFVSPKNFPTLFKSLARIYKKAKNSLMDIKEEIEREDKFQELKKIENEFKILKNEMNQNIARPELLQIAESVAREKSIDQEIVIEAMEEAIQSAAKRKYGHIILWNTSKVTNMSYMFYNANMFY